jgi:methylenetetrahydrofolate reductase (NADPH)
LRIADIYSRSPFTVSFELFPPKTDEAEAALFRDAVPELARLKPAFFSVTYGAGGGTRDRTLRMVQRVRREHGTEAVAHLTCVGSTRDMIGQALDQAAEMGIENILALRGDPPKGQTAFQAVEGGFSYAIDLIRYVRNRNRFGIGAAFYPEGHLECSDKQLDWDRAAAKVEAGAQVLISQLFYNVEDFFICEDYLRNRRGVKVPIIPGILPFLSAEQIKRFTTLCGAKLPPPVVQRLEQYGADDESVRKYGVEVCTAIARRLMEHGVKGMHVYCLNRVASAAELLRNLHLA